MSNVFSKRLHVKCLLSPYTTHDSVIVRGVQPDGIIDVNFVMCDLERPGNQTCTACRRRIMELYNRGEFTDGVIVP